MSHGPVRRLELPRRVPRYRFSMTPLADAMFQLLVFFMLSSNIAPYSLLEIQPGALPGAGPAAPAPDAPATTAEQRGTAIWTLDRDGIVASGQRFGPDRLGDLADAMAAQNDPRLLLIVRSQVPVQQLVSVLELLASRGISAVQLADGALP